ncbi:TPR repeat region-containing protein [Nocardiopsis terrae]
MYFSPTPCDIDTGKLDQAADDMLDIVSRITGKSGDLEELFDSAAMEFSDLIAEGIRSTANDNHGAWTSALTACWHVWGVVTKWSGDVERYKANIAGLQEEWDSAISANFGFEHDDAGMVEARRALAGALNDRARGYWETLVEEAGENSANLEGGPTVANLRELVDAGVLGFAAYNATRQIMYYPSTFDTGERDAEALLPYLTGDKEPDDEYYRLLEQLAVVNALAADGKRKGEHLRDYQIEYLEEFYAALDEAAENGVVGLPEELDGDHFSASQREHVLGTLGDGLLVLSDERTGGEYDALPESVRDVIAGSGDVKGHGAGRALLDWQSRAAGLGEFFAHADAGMEGGAEFSTRLMAVAANEVDGFSFMEDSNGEGDSVMSDFLDVATRNNDANYALVTGEYPEGVEADLPWNEDSPEDYHVRLLERLYTHDWDDGGEAVRGITDWVADGPAEGDDDTAGQLREKVLEELTILMEDEDFQDSMFGTGKTVTDEDGITWHDVSAGQLNPQLADSFADMFIVFQDAFANTDGVPGNAPLGHGEGVELTSGGRVAFTQLAMGDPDAADKVYGEALLRTAEAMEEFSTNTGEREPGANIEAASLQTLVEVALLNESTTREANDQEFVDYRNKVATSAVNILGGVAGDAEVSGLVVELAKAVAGEAFEVSGNSAKPHVELSGEWVKSERMMGYALGAAAVQDPDLMAELAEEGIAKRDASGDLYVPPDHSTWEKSGSDAELSKYYGQIDDRPWPDGESNTREAVEDFVRDFSHAQEKWEEHIVDENGNKVERT